MTQQINVFCRDCCQSNLLVEKITRCWNCASTRLCYHDEIDRLSVAHLDCDAFYATVEKRDRPELRNLPVIVGGAQRGVVSAACYIARTYGVRSAMPMFKAKLACPHAVIIKPDMSKYVSVSRQIRKLMEEVTPAVEPVSIDEAFLDLSGTERLHRHPPAITLAKLVTRIETEIGVTASIGLSHNKFLAKFASDLDKPRGFSIIGKSETLSILSNQPVRRIWGVGKSLQKKLFKDGIETIGQLREIDLKDLGIRYGAIGHRLYYLSRGEDHRAIKTYRKSKSISSETTFNTDISDHKQLEDILWNQALKTSRRMKSQTLAGKTINLKMKTSEFKTISRSTSLEDATALADRIFKAASSLLSDLADGTKYRLLGIGVSDLVSRENADLPDLFTEDNLLAIKAEAAVDAIEEKFGNFAVTKGRGFKPKNAIAVKKSDAS